MLLSYRAVLNSASWRAVFRRLATSDGFRRSMAIWTHSRMSKKGGREAGLSKEAGRDRSALVWPRSEDFQGYLVPISSNCLGAADACPELQPAYEDG